MNQIKNTFLLTLHLGAITVSSYALLAFIRSYYPNPDVPGHEYILYGGLLATFYLILFLFIISALIFGKRLVKALLGPKHGMLHVKKPTKIMLFILSIGCIAFIAPMIINYVTKKPVIQLLPEGIIIKNNPIIPWSDVATVYEGRFDFRTVCVRVNNGTVYRISEPDMYINVPTAVEQIQSYRLHTQTKS